jgi:hypothetical protein
LLTFHDFGKSFDTGLKYLYFWMSGSTWRHYATPRVNVERGQIEMVGARQRLKHRGPQRAYKPHPAAGAVHAAPVGHQDAQDQAGKGAQLAQIQSYERRASRCGNEQAIKHRTGGCDPGFTLDADGHVIRGLADRHFNFRKTRCGAGSAAARESSWDALQAVSTGVTHRPTREQAHEVRGKHDEVLLDKDFVCQKRLFAMQKDVPLRFGAKCVILARAAPTSFFPCCRRGQP